MTPTHIPTPELSAISRSLERVLSAEKHALHRTKNEAVLQAHKSGTFPSDFADRIILRAYYHHYSEICAALRMAVVEVIEKRSLTYSDELVCDLEQLFERSASNLENRLASQITKQKFTHIGKIVPTFADHAKSARRTETDAIRVASLLLRRPADPVLTKSQKEDLIDLRPNFFGFGINLNEVIRRIRGK